MPDLDSSFKPAFRLADAEGMGTLSQAVQSGPKASSAGKASVWVSLIALAIFLTVAWLMWHVVSEAANNDPFPSFPTDEPSPTAPSYFTVPVS